jgi:hypothetical protein
MLVNSKVLGFPLCVTFHKESKPSRIRLENGRVRKGTSVVTTCVIRDPSPRGQIFCSGQSKQNMRDKYNHVTGKRIALARALRFPPFEQAGLREEFWAEFCKTFLVTK